MGYGELDPRSLEDPHWCQGRQRPGARLLDFVLFEAPTPAAEPSAPASASSLGPSLILFRRGDWSEPDVTARIQQIFHVMGESEITPCIIVVASGCAGGACRYRDTGRGYGRTRRCMLASLARRCCGKTAIGAPGCRLGSARRDSPTNQAKPR